MTRTPCNVDTLSNFAALARQWESNEHFWKSQTEETPVNSHCRKRYHITEGRALKHLKTIVLIFVCLLI